MIGAVFIFVVGKAGGDRRLLQSVLRADVDRFAVAARTFAAHGAKQFVQNWVVDHAHHAFAVLVHADGDRHVRYAVNKVGGAVNRVDVDGFVKYCAEIPPDVFLRRSVCVRGRRRAVFQ